MNTELKTLHKKYGRTSDDEIRALLKRIKLVVLTSKGVGSRFGYYTFADGLMKRICKEPRGISHTWDSKPGTFVKKPLKEFKSVRFLVKSSSPFFLKPDIGEVFDQMSDADKKRAVAIYTYTDSECVNSNDGHFICTAILLE